MNLCVSVPSSIVEPPADSSAPPGFGFVCRDCTTVFAAACSAHERLGAFFAERSEAFTHSSSSSRQHRGAAEADALFASHRTFSSFVEDLHAGLLQLLVCEHLAQLLETEYTCQISASEAAARYSIPCRGDSTETVQLCLWCTGITGLVPGTASRSEVVESFHRPWKQDIQAMGDASNVKVVLPRMQAQPTKWGREDRLRFRENVWFRPPEIGNVALSPLIMRALHRFAPEVYYRHRDLPNFRESASGFGVLSSRLQLTRQTSS